MSEGRVSFSSLYQSPKKGDPMAFFSKILEKLGFGTSANAAPQATTAAPASPAATPKESAPKSVAVVDVVAQLEQRAVANPQKLNWRTSIVDLLKLLDIDSSFNARKDGRFREDEYVAT
jgi:hypothetical protein